MRVFLLYATYIMSGVYLSIFTSPFFSLMAIALVLFIVDIFLSREDTIGYSISNLYLFFTLKRVKTEYGRFYIRYKTNVSYYGDTVILYQDKFFYMKEISRRAYSGDIDDLKNWIKGQYGYIYDELIRSNERSKEIHSWNGYVDLQSERDSKLDKLKIK